VLAIVITISCTLIICRFQRPSFRPFLTITLCIYERSDGIWTSLKCTSIISCINSTSTRPSFTISLIHCIWEICTSLFNTYSIRTIIFTTWEICVTIWL